MKCWNRCTATYKKLLEYAIQNVRKLCMIFFESLYILKSFFQIFRQFIVNLTKKTQWQNVINAKDMYYRDKDT